MVTWVEVAPDGAFSVNDLDAPFGPIDALSLTPPLLQCERTYGHRPSALSSVTFPLTVV
jgi:hypothetical protein